MAALDVEHPARDRSPAPVGKPDARTHRVASPASSAHLTVEERHATVG